MYMWQSGRQKTELLSPPPSPQSSECGALCSPVPSPALAPEEHAQRTVWQQ